MNWNIFEKLRGEPEKSTPPVHIPVRMLGIEKVVFVRTKRNGGIKTRKIEVTQIN